MQISADQHSSVNLVEISFTVQFYTKRIPINSTSKNGKNLQTISDLTLKGCLVCVVIVEIKGVNQRLLKFNLN